MQKLHYKMELSLNLVWFQKLFLAHLDSEQLRLLEPYNNYLSLIVLAVLLQRSLMRAIIIVGTRILNFIFIRKRFGHHRPFSILKI